MRASSHHLPTLARVSSYVGCAGVCAARIYFIKFIVYSRLDFSHGFWLTVFSVHILCMDGIHCIAIPWQGQDWSVKRLSGSIQFVYISLVSMNESTIFR